MIDFQIPDEAYNYLRDLLDQDGNTQWEIGRFICDFWEEMLRYVKPDEVRDAHAKLIRQFAKGTGADPTTLRDREKMWLFFADFDRSRFPMLSYHQWRALRKGGKEDLEYWAKRAHDENMSVSKIREAIAEKESPTEVLLKRIDKIGKATRKIMDDQEVPEEVRESLILIPTILEDTKELLHA
jgi:hypothetical protein